MAIETSSKSSSCCNIISCFPVSVIKTFYTKVITVRFSAKKNVYCVCVRSTGNPKTVFLTGQRLCLSGCPGEAVAGPLSY